MGSVLDIGVKTKYENELTSLKLSATEEMWLSSIAEHHSYFKLELRSDNKIKGAYLMDASNAEKLTEEDKKSYNFEKRLKDEKVVQKKLNLRKFLKFWDKHLVLSLGGHNSVEYVKGKRYEKTYMCRPLGWVIEDFKADNYGK